MIDPKSLSVLKATLQILQGLERDLPSTLEDLSTELQVEVGHVLSGFSMTADRALAAIKSSLRDKARATFNSRYGTHLLKGSENTRCSIHFPRPTVQLSRHADLDRLKRELGDSFSSFFETKYVPVKDYQERINDFGADLTLEQRDLLYLAIDVFENTPRVKFEDDVP